MDLISMILGLPLAPVRGFAALVEVLRDEAERELYDPSRLRKQTEEVDSLVTSGQLSPEEGEQLQEEMLEHLQVVPAKSAEE